DGGSTFGPEPAKAGTPCASEIKPLPSTSAFAPQRRDKLGSGSRIPGAVSNRARALSLDGDLKAELHLLQTARRHADAGRLKEAVALCEKHLRQYGASAEAYYLLGLVLDAQSDPNAIECYRKALYLEPNHYETLLQMAVLSQRTGDVSRADQYKRRAKRVSRENDRV